MKSTMGASASGIPNLATGTVSINHTIGQSSGVNHFISGQLHLLQGFQHPFLLNCSDCYFQTAALSVYPNPSQGIISIRWTDDVQHDWVWMNVVDVHGKIIIKTLLERKGQAVSFDASSLPKATYILQLRGNKSGYATHILILI